MAQFNFQPIEINESSPKGAFVIRTFDEIAAFILESIELPRRPSGHWKVVRQNLAQARFGAKREEVHAAMRAALAAEGWLGK